MLVFIRSGMKALVMVGQWIGIVGTRYINIDQDLSNGRPNTPATRQLKYTMPDIFTYWKYPMVACKRWREVDLLWWQ